jgi:hypothetical protein
VICCQRPKLDILVCSRLIGFGLKSKDWHFALGYLGLRQKVGIYKGNVVEEVEPLFLPLETERTKDLISYAEKLKSKGM